MKRTAYIAIVGRPNVGKSSLMNAIIGEKVAIVSNKPQTTRNRIAGIHTVGNDQYVFLDTPGMHQPKTRLGDFMQKQATESMFDADAVILVVEAGREKTSIEDNVIEYLKKSGVPGILVINKIDLIDKELLAQTLVKYSALHDFAAYVPVSVKKDKGVTAVFAECKKFLSESEWFFDGESFTDQPERQLAAEIVREKILRSLNKEVPHGIAVVIEEFKESSKLISIRAEIYCERTSHKGIIIGKNGETLKMISTKSREEMEKFFGMKVFLDVWVKVKENWRDSDVSINNFGYRQ